ncbi:unnamed protein product, partial [Rotaria sp. Silwood1]
MILQLFHYLSRRAAYYYAN